MPSGTVRVTGASSGIGHATALHLAELGFDAVGAVRRDEDAERLRAEGLRAVQLDITDASTITAAREALLTRSSRSCRRRPSACTGA